MTLPGMTLGSVQYMSPEQARGEQATERSDIYSLGVVLFEMLAGRRPFEGDSAASIAMARLTPPVPMPSVYRAGHPARARGDLPEGDGDRPGRAVPLGHWRWPTRSTTSWPTEPPVWPAAGCRWRGRRDRRGRRRPGEPADPVRPRRLCGGRSSAGHPATACPDDRRCRAVGLDFRSARARHPPRRRLPRLPAADRVRRPRPPRQVIVPNFVGSTLDQATQLAEAKGLQLTPQFVKSNEQPEGTITAQDPGAEHHGRRRFEDQRHRRSRARSSWRSPTSGA